MTIIRWLFWNKRNIVWFRYLNENGIIIFKQLKNGNNVKIILKRKEYRLWYLNENGMSILKQLKIDNNQGDYFVAEGI